MWPKVRHLHLIPKQLGRHFQFIPKENFSISSVSCQICELLPNLENFYISGELCQLCELCRHFHFIPKLETPEFTNSGVSCEIRKILETMDKKKRGGKSSPIPQLLPPLPLPQQFRQFLPPLPPSGSPG